MLIRSVYSGVVKYATSRLNTTNFGYNILLTRTVSVASSDEFILHKIVNNKGVLTLNRPTKLNAVNCDTIKKILCKLVEWENKVEMVVINGKGKAFCSGGDVVSGVEDKQRGKEFFRTEYTLAGLLSQYPVPYVALLDGITFGVGLGISVHGPVRIATERTWFSMPESRIGLFTDFGVGHVFSKMPYHLGQYLALTGHKLSGTDGVKAGIATHYAKSENIPIILKGLLELKEPRKNLNKFLLKHTEDLDDIEFSLKPHLNVIDKAFSATSVEEIIERLQNNGSEFTLQTAEILKKMSPMSMKINKRILELYKNINLLEGLEIENRVAANFLDVKATTDFYEGVRALLIDRDFNPKWNPATLQEVTDEILDRAFGELSPEEEFNFEVRLNEWRKKFQS